VAAYRITARSLERQLVGEDVLKEFASLEDCTTLEAEAAVAPVIQPKVVLVLEEDEERESPLRRSP
jgi:hypothetical protein